MSVWNTVRYILRMIRLGLVAIVGAAMSIGTSAGQQPVVTSTSAGDSLKTFLRTCLNPGRLGPDTTTRITVVSVKAEGEAAEGASGLCFRAGVVWERWLHPADLGACQFLVQSVGKASHRAASRSPSVLREGSLPETRSARRGRRHSAGIGGRNLL